MGEMRETHRLSEDEKKGLHTFSPTNQGALQKDLLQLKAAIGGNPGSISVGGQKLEDVLRVGKNLFVTTNAVPKSIETALNMGGADIHRIRSQADLAHFVQRFRNFDQ